jgi:hypothetical protein
MPLRRKTEKIQDIPIPVQDEKNLLYFPIDDLPSKFICYPEGLEVRYRRYGWLEIKLLSQRTDSLSLRTQTDMVFRGLKFSDPTFSPYSLTFPDYQFLGLLRKVATLMPPSFDLRYMCQKCNKISSFTVPVTSIQFDEIKAPKGRAVVEMEGLTATFQPLTIGQFIEVCDKKVEFPAWEEEMVWSASCVSHSMDEVFTYLKEQATPDDARLLRELDRLFFHGIMPIKHECTNFIIEVNDTLEHERLEAMDGEQLKKELNAKGVNFSWENSDLDLENYEAKEGIITKTRCGQSTELSLTGGEGLIIPFRINGRSFDDAIVFDGARAPAHK